MIVDGKVPKRLKDMRLELGLLKMVWDTVCLVQFLFSSWKSTLWADIDTEVLLDETKMLQTQIKKLPPSGRGDAFDFEYGWALYHTRFKGGGSRREVRLHAAARLGSRRGGGGGAAGGDRPLAAGR